MSSLIVSHDLRIMMLELAVKSLHVPWRSTFDRVILKRTAVLFRLLDDEWTTLRPQRTDGLPYRGSNRDWEPFHGGGSVIFSVPESTLEECVDGVDLQLYAYKEISKHFKMDPCQVVGFVLVRVDDLFNGIIKELRERKELADYLSSYHEREPVSRSLRGKYPLMSEALGSSGASIELYVRLSYLGKCVITEIELTELGCKAFRAREESSEGNPYECGELTEEDIRSGRWISPGPILPAPIVAWGGRLLTCQCDQLADQPEPLERISKISHEGIIGYRTARRQSRRDEDGGIMEKGERTMDNDGMAINKGEMTVEKGAREMNKGKEYIGVNTVAQMKMRARTETKEKTKNGRRMSVNKSTKKGTKLTSEELRKVQALIRSNARRGGTATVGISEKKKKVYQPQAPILPISQRCCCVTCCRPICFI